ASDRATLIAARSALSTSAVALGRRALHTEPFRAVLQVGLPVLMAGAGLLLVGLGQGLARLLLLVALPTIVAFVYLLWRLDPAYTLSAAICLSPFAGNWQ